MIIFGYNITESLATLILAIATVLMAVAAAISAIFTAFAAHHTKKLAQYNKDLITQSEIQHRERFQPLCFPFTEGSNVIDFRKAISMGAPSSNLGKGTPPRIKFLVCNKGLGPAINLRFHINNIQNQRITKDFLITHALPPNEEYPFVSHIPPLNIPDENGGLLFGMEPSQVVNDAYFIVCEYGSMFSKETFSSIVAKGYRDPSLAGDGNNHRRLNRPLTPSVEFSTVMDPSKPIWNQHLPPDEAIHPAEFLNFPSENEQST